MKGVGLFGLYFSANQASEAPMTSSQPITFEYVYTEFVAQDMDTQTSRTELYDTDEVVH